MLAHLLKGLPPPKGLPRLIQWPGFGLFGGRIVWRLALARRQFANFSMSLVATSNAVAGTMRGSLQLTSKDQRLLAWVSYAMPRMARLVPWRSDCLVQSLAAQQLLTSHGIASQIEIGVERPLEGEFGAHAWLKCGDFIVTGGDEYARYTRIV